MVEIDIVEAHCYFVDIGRTDREQYVAESITMIAGRFGHEGLCQLHSELFTEVPCAVGKGLRGRNVLQSLLLILLRICS